MAIVKKAAIVLYVFLVAQLLMGCSSAPINTVTTRTEYKHPSVPEHLFKPVTVERYMATEEHLKLGIPERETALREYAQKVLKALKDSNNNVRDIKKILDDAKKAADNESKSRD